MLRMQLLIAVERYSDYLNYLLVFIASETYLQKTSFFSVKLNKIFLFFRHHITGLLLVYPVSH